MKRPLAERIEKLGGQHLHQIPWTFAQLKKEYQGQDQFFVEVTNRENALSDIASKTSCCWGAGHKFGDTGWIQLATPSKRHKEDKQTIFVCKASLIA